MHYVTDVKCQAKRTDLRKCVTKHTAFRQVWYVITALQVGGIDTQVTAFWRPNSHNFGSIQLMLLHLFPTSLAIENLKDKNIH